MPEPKKYPAQDCQGQKIKKGDIVLVKELPKLSAKKGDEFEVVRVAFNHILDTSNEVLGFDEFGHVELSFEISKGKFPGQHTVWIEPFFLQVKSAVETAKAKPGNTKPVKAKSTPKKAVTKIAAKKAAKAGKKSAKPTAAKTPTAKKPIAKKAASKKTSTKIATKVTAKKKVAAKKVVAKKAPTKKVATKKTATKSASRKARK